MDCREVERNDVAEAYIAGRLSAAQSEAFEEHYFECDACFRRLEACRALRSVLAGRRNDDLEASRSVRTRVWLSAAAAAAIVVVVLLGRYEPSPPRDGHARDSDEASPPRAASVPVAPSPAPSAPLAALGRFDPPVYSEATWRRVPLASQEPFRAGMRRYMAGDYAGAVPDLVRAVSSSPDSAAAHFYLGLCRLHTREVKGGIASLERSIAVGDTPFLEPALFYLAKGFLLGNDHVAARTRLMRAAELKGDLEIEARALLRAIDEAARSRP